MFGKVVADLQTDIVVGDDAISGTLYHVDDYTGFSGDPSLQDGHYLALHVAGEAEEITVELIGGTSGPVKLDEDRIIVLYIADKDTQSVQVIATEGEYTRTLNYLLSSLTLE